ncbi:unnamed protein product, partial [Discosporangium mesarthrocarpum]
RANGVTNPTISTETPGAEARARSYTTGLEAEALGCWAACSFEELANKVLGEPLRSAQSNKGGGTASPGSVCGAQDQEQEEEEKEKGEGGREGEATERHAITLEDFGRSRTDEALEQLQAEMEGQVRAISKLASWIAEAVPRRSLSGLGQGGVLAEETG